MKGFSFIRLFSVALLLVLATTSVVFTTSCTPSTVTTEKVGVVVTILPQADFVDNIGGEKVNITVMVPPGADPHSYEPTPSQMVEVSKAKMYAKVGSGIEFELAWIDKIIAQNKDMLVVDCSKGVELIEMVAHHHEGEHEGEHHGGMDPHIWTSPLNAKTMVKNICDGLVKVDPGNKDYYTQNKDEYLAKLDKLDADIRDGLSGVENRHFIVFHPAWGYFAKDYNVEQIPIEIGGKEPSAKDMAHLIDEAKEHNIKIVFASPEFSVKSAETIAKEIGGRVAFIDPLARDYLNNMHIVLGEMVQSME